LGRQVREQASTDEGRKDRFQSYSRHEGD